MESNYMDKVVSYIVVVGFDHSVGHCVEWVYPNDKGFQVISEQDEQTQVVVPPVWEVLPSLALPDGSHLLEQDYNFFVLPSLDETSTVYGISSYKQIPVEKLRKVPANIKRSFIQKSVVVISKLPLFGLIQMKLAAVTQAYFEQGDFSNTEILRDIYDRLNASISVSPTEYPVLNTQTIFIGLSAADFVRKFRRNSLTLLKTLLLQQTVVIVNIFAPVSEASKTVLSLLSLLPGQLAGLLPSTLQVHKEEYKQLNLPLNIFDGYKLYPYLSIQDIPLVKQQTTRLLGGASNALYLSCSVPTVEMLQDKSPVLKNFESRISSLSSADTHFIDRLIKESDARSLSQSANFEGSDEWIRSEFENYIVSLLYVVGSQLTSVDESAQPQSSSDPFSDFNSQWVQEWMKTTYFQEWKQHIDKQTFTSEPNRPVCHPSRCDPTFSSAIFGKVQNLTSSALHSLRERKDSLVGSAPPLSELKSQVGHLVDSTLKFVKNDKDKDKDKEATEEPKESNSPSFSTNISLRLSNVVSSLKGIQDRIAMSFEEPTTVTTTTTPSSDTTDNKT